MAREGLSGGILSPAHGIDLLEQLTWRTKQCTDLALRGRGDKIKVFYNKIIIMLLEETLQRLQLQKKSDLGVW